MKIDVMKSRNENCDEFAARMVEAIRSGVSIESNASSQISHVTVKPTQTTIMNILQQNIDLEFLIAIVCLAVFVYAAYSLIASIASLVTLFGYAVAFLPPTDKDQPESKLLLTKNKMKLNNSIYFFIATWQRLKRSIRPKTREEKEREKNKKAIKQVKKVLKSKDVGRGIANFVDAILDSD